MLRRDDYIEMLEKRAAGLDGGKTGPTYDHDLNSADVGTEEHKRNLADNRQTLEGLFSTTGAAVKNETAFAKKWFPGARTDKETSSPLIKVAMETLSQSETFRGYPAHYKAAAVLGFTKELEKIAMSFAAKGAIGGGVIGGATLLGMNRLHKSLQQDVAQGVHQGLQK